MQTSLLVAQKRVIEEIAKAGKDCVIVGWNTDVLLADKKPFHIFVCAGMEAKIRRCMERASEGENISLKGAEKNIRRIDKSRAKTREILEGGKWGRAVPISSPSIRRGGIWKNLRRQWKDLSCAGMGGKYAYTTFGSF